MTDPVVPTDHPAPAGLRVRGTLVVVPGRGETRTTYSRLGRRLAADAYRVRVVDAPRLDPDDPDGALTRFGNLLARAVAGTAGEDGSVVGPLVLIGADSGAVAVAALLGRAGLPGARQPDAVVLAGLPGPGGGSVGGWEEELDARTACPVHRDTLAEDAEDAGVRRGSLNDAVPDALLTAAHESGIGVPALLLAGEDDPLADHDALTRWAKSLTRARLAVVRGARHDVLNDLQHRSVAAETVTFLENLRNDLVPLIGVETSAW